MTAMRPHEQAAQAYRTAGVDIDAADAAKERIKHIARATFTPGVLSEIGGYGGLFEVKNYREPVLVSHTDSVGTKVRIAALLEKYNTVGIDIVHHCINDIFCCGADPLFFLDYLGLGKLHPDRVEQLVGGVAKACQALGCALIGGETAELPGLYDPSDYDLVGFIVGAVEKTQMLTGSAIRAGDVLLGIPSSGLHTNGYSLVRSVLALEHDPAPLLQHYPEMGKTLGEALLEPHRCYYPVLKPHLALIKGMAHITGGGFPGNVHRILPPGLTAVIDTTAWTPGPLFRLIQQRGGIDPQEMYRVFNMGIGMVVACAAERAKALQKALSEAVRIGSVEPQAARKERVVLLGVEDRK